jgi:hypothetical protein
MRTKAIDEAGGRRVQAPLAVHAANLDETTRRGLEVFFEGPCRGAFRFVDADMADLGLLDVDAVRGVEELHRYLERHPDRTVIVFGSPPETLVADRLVLLDKPLQPARLRRVLEVTADRDAEERQGCSEATGPLPDGSSPSPVDPAPAAVEEPDPSAAVADPWPPPAPAAAAPASVVAEPPPSALPSRAAVAPSPLIADPPRSTEPLVLAPGETYDPARYLQGALRSACRTSRHPVEVTLRGARLVVDPGAGTVTLDCTLTQVRLACSRPGEAQVRRLRRAPAGTGGETMDADALLWQVALWCSGGRLPADVDPRAPLRLRHWPDLTRRARPDAVMTCCARWSRRPTSVAELVDSAPGSRAEIFSTCAALLACDLLIHDQETSGPAADRAVDVPRRHLLGRIIGRLRAA